MYLQRGNVLTTYSHQEFSNADVTRDFSMQGLVS